MTLVTVTLTWAIPLRDPVTMQDTGKLETFTARWDLKTDKIDMVVSAITGRYPMDRAVVDPPGLFTSISLGLEGGFLTWEIDSDKANEIDSWMHTAVGRPAEITVNGETLETSESRT